MPFLRRVPRVYYAYIEINVMVGKPEATDDTIKQLIMEWLVLTVIDGLQDYFFSKV